MLGTSGNSTDGCLEGSVIVGGVGLLVVAGGLSVVGGWVVGTVMGVAGVDALLSRLG